MDGFLLMVDVLNMYIFETDSHDRLMREVQIMRRLRHLNIIRIVEALDTPEQV